MIQSFNVILFPFSRYWTKCVIKFLFRLLMIWKNFKIYLRSSFQTMADREKEGKTGIQKFEYLKNEKNFLDEIKSILHNYLRAIIWLKKWKIADATSFEYKKLNREHEKRNVAFPWNEKSHNLYLKEVTFKDFAKYFAWDHCIVKSDWLFVCVKPIRFQQA